LTPVAAAIVVARRSRPRRWSRRLRSSPGCSRFGGPLSDVSLLGEIVTAAMGCSDDDGAEAGS